ncbi:MAG: pseudouridine synthase [Cellvibrio sp. 79]|nr:MAG: pseudouridine synthase [Cellvibrio sp. 79]
MNERYITIAETLIDIERELRELRLWEAEMLPDAALASEQPFAVDTMTFPQWLQFIFLPRMYFLLDEQLPLPGNCGIAPMAEQYFSGLNLYSPPLIAQLKKIDALLTHSR